MRRRVGAHQNESTKPSQPRASSVRGSAVVAAGTRALAEAIAASPAFSIAGGGDTVAAIHKFGVADRISYISTAGGAFLEFLEGRTLPAVAILEARAKG